MTGPGCGSCGKPKPGPHGSQKPTPSPSNNTSMAAQTQSFSLKLATGEKLTVNGSLLEATATLVRLGGNGTIE